MFATSLRSNPNDPHTHTTTIFSEFSLQGKTAVVTGGNGGLGELASWCFARAWNLQFGQTRHSKGLRPQIGTLGACAV